MPQTPWEMREWAKAVCEIIRIKHKFWLGSSGHQEEVFSIGLLPGNPDRIQKYGTMEVDHLR